MKKYLLISLVIIGIAGVGYFMRRSCPLRQQGQQVKVEEEEVSRNAKVRQGLELLKTRKDAQALVVFEEVLLAEPQNLDALWGKAEVLRRERNYQQAEELLNKILSKDPKHNPALTSLAYIRYKDDKLNEAMELVDQVLKSDSLNKESRALAYMMVASINSRRSKKGWFFSKIAYGTQIKGYFLKARDLTPDLPEVHLGLGSFYLLAPGIIGGNLNQAFEELELAVKMAPDFATANARLAQAYKKKGNLEKYNYYLARAKELDPENEALKEITRDGSLDKQGRFSSQSRTVPERVENRP